MTHEATIRRFAEIVKNGWVGTGNSRNGTCKTAWKWGASGLEAGQVFLKLLPWLETKQAEARVALHYIADKEYHKGRKTSREQQEIGASYYIRLKEMK